jgi:uncharacterized protein YbjT (DUF2867 family)
VSPAAEASDADALAAAFAGADGVYVLVPPDVRAAPAIAAARRTSAAIAEAARRAGVRHVVALSSAGAHLPDGTGLVRTLHDLEAALRAALGGTGAALTIVRATDFIENWEAALPAAREQGVLPSTRTPLDGPMECVSVVDVGRAAAECLLAGPPAAPRRERVLNLLGPAEYTPRDVAAAFAAALGRPVEPVLVPRDAFVPAFLEGGIGDDYARGLAELYDALNAGRLVFEPGVGETRRGTVTLREAAERIAAATTVGSGAAHAGA